MVRERVSTTCTLPCRRDSTAQPVTLVWDGAAASQMVYRHYLPDALALTVTPTARPRPPAVPVDSWPKNLTCFAMGDAASGRVVLRLVNSNNVSVALTVSLSSGGGGTSSGSHGVGPVVDVQTLQDPLFGTPQYAQESRGGWNTPMNTTFISPSNSSWARGEDATYHLPPMSFVVMRFSPRS
jgi:hypothetical protein